MSTLRIVFLSLLFASATLCSAAADHQNSVEVCKSWEYGGKNTGGQFETVTEGIPANEHFQGTRLAQHEDEAKGLMLGQEEKQSRGITSGINNPNLPNPYALAVYYIGGDLVACDTSSDGSPIDLSHYGWHTLPAVNRSLWGTMHLQGKSLLYVSHSASVQFENGDPIVITNTSVQRYGLFKLFLARGYRKKLIGGCGGELLRAHRVGQLRATMENVVGAEVKTLSKQAVNLSVRLLKRRVLRLPGNGNRLRILPFPSRYTIARWRFEGYIGKLEQFGAPEVISLPQD